ncbi:hypothetical protein [Zhihengliuella halotolerans]|uniref:hypothetical protein n=1 Tax=Zhihengliuella halotolerans TaxID=370736 RepID=UPI0011AF9737|nr:hypothetical protein [Zhihengliuella halotolerans]
MGQTDPSVRRDSRAVWHVLIFLVILPIVSLLTIFGTGLVDVILRSSESSPVAFGSLLERGSEYFLLDGDALRFFLTIGATIVLGGIVGRSFGEMSGYSPEEAVDLNDRFSALAAGVGLMCEAVVVMFTVSNIIRGSGGYALIDYIIYLAAAYMIAWITWVVSQSRSELLTLNRMNLERTVRNERRKAAVYRVLWGELPWRAVGPRKVTRILGLPKWAAVATIFAVLYMVAIVALGLIVRVSGAWWLIALSGGFYFGLTGLLVAFVLAYNMAWSQSAWMHRIPAIFSCVFALGIIILMWSTISVSNLDYVGFLGIFLAALLVSMGSGICAGFTGATGSIKAIRVVSAPFVWIRESGANSAHVRHLRLIEKIRNKVAELSEAVDTGTGRLSDQQARRCFCEGEVRGG